MKIPEIRYNLITRDWVIVSPSRGKRPDEFKDVTVSGNGVPEHKPDCPFCPGNEDKTPPEVFRIANGNRGWQIRVIPNKFAALSREGDLYRRMKGIKRSVTGVGIHEVIIEHPLHNATTALLGSDAIRKILLAYKNRYLEIYKDPRIQLVIIFKNHGEGAGTSLEHPHSQIIGTPVMPPNIRHRMEEAMRYYDDTGECVYCKVMASELVDLERVVVNGVHFLSFISYAALSPFHTWIFPKRHASSFGEIRTEELEDLAEVLRITLAKLYYRLNNPDFNYIIRSIPDEGRGTEYFHWYITIVPRLGKMAGFELGSGMFINPSPPENDARLLRETPTNIAETPQKKNLKPKSHDEPAPKEKFQPPVYIAHKAKKARRFSTKGS
jgi:UDPglucose--hexose-1-phosphate uridylyltransferase